ncbi:MAG: carboxypeptidase-like regulatory domain-containing protein [Chitinophagaceae bacterium]|nr:carboxypeptidase-like regulatory domain-containing protein [Flavisolibacter longurius]RYZ50041.1 MAG: carboxypeptidase-like regulatory domain-containing protein [Chitinophagaceae bacterium]
MKKALPVFFLLSFFWSNQAAAQFETVKDSVVQLYGIVMTADSLVGIPAVSVSIRGSNRGTVSNNQGVFSIVALKGDIVEFTHVSFKPKTVVIPRNIEGNQYNVVQLLVEDTVYLPATIIRPKPSPEQFARDFVTMKVPDDDIEIARQNNSAAKRRILMESTPTDGASATAMQFRNVANRAVYQGQTPPMNIFNPAAWSEFIKSWKRGDYKRKN